MLADKGYVGPHTYHPGIHLTYDPEYNNTQSRTQANVRVAVEQYFCILYQLSGVLYGVWRQDHSQDMFRKQRNG